MADNAHPNFTAAAVHNIDDPFGNTCIHKNLYERCCRGRRVRCRLEHHSVATEQRREDLPRGDGHREVPRGHHTGNADRHAHRHVEFVRQLRGNGVAEKTTRLGRSIIGCVNSFLHIAPGLQENLPHFTRHLFGDLFFSRCENISGLFHDVAPFWCRNETP